MNEIKLEQNNDIVLKQLIKWLNDKKRPDAVQEINSPHRLIFYWRQFNRFHIKNGIVYYKWRINNGKHRDLIVVTESIYEKVIKLYHDNMSHSGIENSVDICRRKYWFHRMTEEFKIYIQACPKCNEIKQPRKILKANLQPIIFTEFNQGIAIDHIVPSKELITARKNRYILTITCMFTGYLVAVPIKSQEAEETIKVVIREWICKMGFPQSILHDQHKNFTSDLFKACMKMFGIADSQTTPFYSQGNGKCESQNKRINGALRAALKIHQWKDWDLYLKYVVLTLNSLKSSRTGVSANFLLFGRELRAPQDLFTEDIEPETYENIFGNQENLKKRAAYEIHKNIRQIMCRVQRTFNAHVQYMSKQYNKNTSDIFFQIGDWVYVKINKVKFKFAPTWQGPGQIIEKLSDILYVVKIGDEEKVTNISKLKPYKPSKYFPPPTFGEKKFLESLEGPLYPRYRPP